jgi:hypothetical protein
MIPRYHEIKQPWCNLALDSNLNEPSIIDLLTKISTKKGFQPYRREALKNENIFKLAKPSVTVKPLLFYGKFKTVSNPFFAYRSKEARCKGKGY